MSFRGGAACPERVSGTKRPRRHVYSLNIVSFMWRRGYRYALAVSKGLFTPGNITQIELSTPINAPIGRCFDLSRSIDLHMESTKQTGEQAIAGRTSGLIELGETVTWRAKHFGIWQNLTSKITEFDYPNYFTDEMVSGAFKGFRHEHLFFAVNNQTVMKDIFGFESPYGRLGRLVNFLFLGRYMQKLLKERNRVIKEAAETAD